MSDRTPGMLAGITILDLSLFVAGPFGSMILADLGAEVIKIEPIEGDPVRANRMGPQLRGENAQFQSYNRNKKGICLNLKDARGRELFLELVKGADVVFDNFRPGVLARLGIDHASLTPVNPRIVSVSVSAFGQDGPLAKSPGYDIIVQALGGGMCLTGDARSGPAHIPFHLGDTAGGMYAAIAILGAIIERNRTGAGRALDISLLDAQIGLMGDEVTYFHASGKVPPPHGSGHPLLSAYRAFATADAPLVVAAVGVEKFWCQFAIAIGRPELIDDPRFADNHLRVANRRALDPLLETVLITRTREEWLRIFASADVPAAAVSDIAAALAHPQVQFRQMVAEMELQDGSRAFVARTPIRGSGQAPHEARAAPTLGEHTRSVLQERLELDTARIDALYEQGVVG